jgi:hypothetical protein
MNFLLTAERLCVTIDLWEDSLTKAAMESPAKKRKGGTDMICPFCNKEIKDDSAFCPLCGGLIQSEKAAAEKANEPEPVDASATKDTVDAKNNDKRPRRIGRIAAAISVLSVAVIALLFVGFWENWKGMMLRGQEDPTEYFTYVEEKALKADTELIGELYASFLEAEQEPAEGKRTEIDLELDSAGLRKSFPSLALDEGMVSWLNRL